MNGGGKGTPNYFVIEKTNQAPRRLRKVAAESLQAHDLIKLKTGGGGGFGDPFDRDPEKVLNDVVDEYASVEQAKNEYGVVIDETHMMVDLEATKTLRGSLLSQAK